MPARILVPLKRHDRFEELEPYLQLLACRGSTVVFLIPMERNPFPWWLEAISVPARDCRDVMPIAILAATSSCEHQLQRAAQRLAVIRRILEAQGVVVHVECYEGSLKSALARYCKAGGRTIVLRRKLPIKWRALFSFMRWRIRPSEPVAMTLSLPRQLP